jgi:membrane protein YdbS with pleckstrin-like domain
VSNLSGTSPPPRSALTLRLVLAAFGLIVCVGAAVIFTFSGLPPALIVVAVLLAVVAAVDLVVVITRKARGEPG